MIFLERTQRARGDGVGDYARQCEAPGCFHSGRYTARFLGAYDVRLCASCRAAWAKAWDDAKTNWQEAA